MSRILAFLAVLALVVSPLNAAAAQDACAQMQLTMSAQADGMGSKAMADNPCCDHGQKAPADHDKTCAQICAAMAGPTATMSAEPSLLVLAVSAVSNPDLPDIPRTDRTRPPADPPPRSIA